MILNGSTKSLSEVSKNKAVAVESYFKTIENQLKSFYKNKMVVDAAFGLKREFKRFNRVNGATGRRILDQKADLAKYYLGDFSAEYEANNQEKVVEAKILLDYLDPQAIAFQYSFISNNEHPLGFKHHMDGLKRDESRYSCIHENVHPVIRKYLERFGY